MTNYEEGFLMSVEHPTPSPHFRLPFFKKGLSKPSAKGSKKRLIIIGGAAILILAAVIASTLMPLQGKLLTVHPEEFTKGFTEEGQILAAKEWPFYNAAPGKVGAILVQNGQRVNKGQVLLQIETTDLNYQLESLKAQLKSVEGQRLQTYRDPYDALVKQQNLLIEQAKKDNLAQEQNLTRSKALYEAGAIPLSQYEDVQLQAERAKNFLEQQESALNLLYEQQAPFQGTDLYFSGQADALNAQIHQLEEKIQDAKVTALQDGLVKDLSIKEGELVQQGQLLLNIYQSEGYKLESYVLASQSLEIKAGDPVDIIQDTGSGKKTLSGQVVSVDPSAIERISPLGLKENRVRVTLALNSKEPVVLGSSVDVKFITQQEANQLLVPKTALFPYENGEAVWVIRNGKAQIQPIVKGMENDLQVVIKEGLADGDQILLDTEVSGLKEGKRIKPAT
jgi:HlyD family secretion protein